MFPQIIIVVKKRKKSKKKRSFTKEPIKGHSICGVNVKADRSITEFITLANKCITLANKCLHYQ